MAMLSSPLALIQSIPPATRGITLLTVVSSAIYAWSTWRGHSANASYYMLFIPGSCIWTPWTLLTSAFVEPAVLELLLTLLFVPPSLKYLERLWGTIELIKFVVVTIVFSNIIALGLAWIEYFATSNASLFLYGMTYHGQTALQIGILVAFTQLIPEHKIQIGFFVTRIKTLPMAYLTLSTVLCLIGYQNPWILIQFGWFVSWIYLRFYKKSSSDTLGVTYGDRSETFSLVSWFPPFMHPPLTILGNTVYSLANRFHLIPSSTGNHDVESGSYTLAPGGARAEAERRRAMALKALDQRIASNSSPQAGNSTNPKASNIARSDSVSSSQSSQSNAEASSSDPSKGKS